MPNVKTNAVLPKGEENGLADIAGALVAEGLGRSPVKLRAVIAIVAPRRVSVDTKTGDELATVEIRRVEVLLPVDLGAAEKLLRRALESRSGQTTLELELEDEIRQAFDQMLNPDSPEDPEEGGDDQGGKGGKPRGKS
jgi:hypothetical protein